jgi:hypothetical protein
MMDIVDMAIEAGGARENQSLVLKIYHLNFGKLSLLQITDLVNTIIRSYFTFVMQHESISFTKIFIKG